MCTLWSPRFQACKFVILLSICNKWAHQMASPYARMTDLPCPSRPRPVGYYATPLWARPGKQAANPPPGGSPALAAVRPRRSRAQTQRNLRRRRRFLWPYLAVLGFHQSHRESCLYPCNRMWPLDSEKYEAGSIVGGNVEFYGLTFFDSFIQVRFKTNLRLMCPIDHAYIYNQQATTSRYMFPVATDQCAL